MRLLSFEQDDRVGLALRKGDGWLDIGSADDGLPDDVAGLLSLPDWKDRVARAALGAPDLDLQNLKLLPPVWRGEKILCVGLNYIAHVAESPYPQPEYPVFFPRFASSLIAHEAPLVKPYLSNQFDYEGELVIVVGKHGRHISRDSALEHVAGYTIFNEGSVRDYQFKSSQWTMGKNFDGTGACGPWFVSADELPPGASGLRLETRINGKVEQSASTAEMIFDVSTLISLASQVMTLRPGDMIVSGTPAGVGFGKKPQVYLQASDVCEVSIDGIGVLRNIVMDELAQ
jgi:2-keto-4-pentenoate hydratase/2-oxohepta-3-ene-1,7-dioic acid hydratase in catechol pathway